MERIEWRKDETVAILEMTNGENRQDITFANEFNTALQEILEDTEVQALVVTSTDAKNFSQGVDVAWLGQRWQEKDFDTIKGFMQGMDQVFSQLLTYPVPVVAAINGHAFGNGAILAAACDFRFMRKDRGYYCFPEIDAGIPFLPGMIAFLSRAIPAWLFTEMQMTGARYTASQLEQHHVIVKASDDAESVLSDAVEYARSFAKKRGIFGEMKRRRNADILKVLQEENPPIIDNLALMVSD